MSILNYLWTTEFWLVIGILLLICEVLSVSFYFLFLGVGALATSLAVKLGLADSLWVQFTIFSIVSVVSTLLFRDVAKRYLSQNNKAYQGDFVGGHATVTKAIGPKQAGKVSYRGTEWAAEAAIDDAEIETGSLVVIKEMHGMTLRVE